MKKKLLTAIIVGICSLAGSAFSQVSVDIGGANFNDLTGDGITGDDVPLGGFTVELFADNGDGVFTAADTLSGSAITDPITGRYTLTGLTDGLYFVRQVPAAGYTQTVGLPYYELQVDDAQVFVGQQLIIDDFVVPSPATFFQASPTVSNIVIKTPDTSILGGERDLQVLVDGKPGFLSAFGEVGTSVGESLYQLATFGNPGTLTILQYDGLDTDAPGNLIDAQLLGGLDLTSNGASSGIRLRFERLEAGAPVGDDLDLEVRATSVGGANASFTNLILQDLNAFSIFNPFSGFTTDPGFDWTQVTSLQVLINQRAVTDIDIKLDLLSATFLGATNLNFANFAEPSSLSGYVFAERVKDCNRLGTEQPIPNVSMTLMGTNDLGQAVLESTLTDTNGFYAFTNLRPGTYKINEGQPAAFVDGPECPGSLGATVTDDQLADIPLPAGTDGVEYNFCEQLTVDLVLTKRSLPANVNGGDLFHYRFEVINNGPSTATGVLISDLLPAGVEFVSANRVCDTNNLPLIICDMGTLTAGRVRFIDVAVRADCCAGSVINTAVVTAVEAEITLTNNTAIAATTILPDSTAPDIVSCPGDEMLPCNSAIPPADPSLVIVTDNCSSPVVSHVGDVTNASSCLTVVTRTYRATDDCGNFSDCVQVLSLPTDLIDPVITVCPADVILPCNAPAIPAPDPSQLSATDNCGVPVYTHVGDVTNTTSCLTVVTRTYRATDACGNIAECSHTISLPTDQEAPVLTGVPADVTVSCDAVPATNLVTATDNCSTNLVPVFTEQRIDGNCPGNYTLLRTWTTQDACGNPASATQTLTVQDLTPPTITCPVGLSITNCTDSGRVPDLTALATASDNCGSATVAQSPAAGSAFSGTVTITLTATDDCGNTANCQVTVSDYAKIGDFVWIDANGNGIQETGEAGLGGVTVNLLDDAKNIIDTTITLPDGMYMFCVQPGRYCVQVVTNSLPDHFCITRKGVGDPLLNSDAHPDGITDKFDVGPGEMQLSVDIGVYPAGCLEGSVWTDAVQSGLTNNVNLAVLGLSGIRVDICRINPNGTEFLYTTATTLSLPLNNGYFFADKIPAGDYRVKVDPTSLPSNFLRFTTADQFLTTVATGTCGPPLAFGVLPKPTYVELTGFSATHEAGGVSVSWSTGVERDNLGFQLYRSRTINGARSPVGSFTPALAVGAGAQYGLLDISATAGTWYYWLEDADYWLNLTIHGPVRVVVPRPVVTNPEPVELIAAPVQGAVKIVPSEDGRVSFTTEDAYPNYLVTGLNADFQVLDVTDSPVYVLLGVALDRGDARAVYFSAPPGRKIEIK